MSNPWFGTLESSTATGNRLASDSPDRRLAPRWGLYAAVFLLALAPRGVVSYKLDVLCPDGAHYVELATDLERYDGTQLLTHEHFNPFPLALAYLHRLGIEHETAARSLNLALGALLPLIVMGWVRRQFDDVTGLVAGVMCAVHPKLIEWSAEAIREPLFWAAFALAIYALWRAASEARLCWFVVGGLALSLALQTRFEGWLLLILAAWPLARLWHMPAARWRVAIGLVLVLACVPTAPLATSMAAYGPAAGIEWSGSLHKLLYVRMWLEGQPSQPDQPPSSAADEIDIVLPSAMVEVRPEAVTTAPQHALAAARPTPDALPGLPAESPAGDALSATDTPPVTVTSLAADTPPAADMPDAPPPTQSLPAVPPAVAAPPIAEVALPAIDYASPFSRKDALVLFLATGYRGLRPPLLLLMTIGMVVYRRRLLQSDCFPLVLVGLGVAAAIWIHLEHAQQSSSRYFLSIALVALPVSSLAVVSLSRLLSLSRRQLDRLPVPTSGPGLAAAVMLSLLIAVGCGDAVLGSDPTRVAKADLGRWIRQELGPERRLVGSCRIAWLLSYYAEAEYTPFVHKDLNPDNWLLLIDQQQPDMVVLTRGELPPPHAEYLSAALHARGFAPVDAECLPDKGRAQAQLWIASHARKMAPQPDAQEHASPRLPRTDGLDPGPIDRAARVP